MLQLYLLDKAETKKWWLPFGELKWTETLNVGASGTVNVAYHLLKEAASANAQTMRQLLFDNWRKIVIEDEKTEEVIFKGVLTGANINSEESGGANLNLTFADPSCLLSKRLTGAAQNYTDENIMTVASALLTTAQSADDLGLTLGRVDTTTTTVTREYQYAKILDSLVGLSKNKIANGLEWRFNKDWQLDLAYPYLGTEKTYVIFDEQNILDWQNQINLLGNLINQVKIKGKGNVGVLSYADQNAQIAWGVQEGYVSATDLSESESLAERAAQYLADRATPLAGEQIQVTLAGDQPDWRSYDVGDWVKLRLVAFDLETLIRISKKQICCSKEMITVGVTLAPQNSEADFGQNYRELLRRLQRLENI